MLFNSLALSSVLFASALAVADPAPYKLGKISMNQAFGLMRRQAGYAPTQTFCGPGTDCASSCGAGYVKCASSDGDLHCYDPTIQQTCCPDGSGNSCSQGYFCTSDSSGGTWCCPDGMSLAGCAALHTLTGALVSETASYPPAPTSSYSPSSVTANVSGNATTTSSSSGSTITYTSPYSNVTYTNTTSSTPTPFAGSAVRATLGFPALALAAAGAVLVF